MGRGNLNEEEIRALRNNPYVVDVNKRGVSYSNDFKILFITEYLKGHRPTEIFRNAGFDVRILGSKRIERACARWKESYEAGTLGARSAKLEKCGGAESRRHESGAADEDMDRFKESVLEICRNQVKEIKRISAENEMLKYILEEASQLYGKTDKNDKAGRHGKFGRIGTEKLCMIIRDVSEKAEFQGCVSHLCHSAGISRNTYYSYCRSKQ